MPAKVSVSLSLRICFLHDLHVAIQVQTASLRSWNSIDIHATASKWCSAIISCWNTNLLPLIPAWPASNSDNHLFLNFSSLSSERFESVNISCLMWIWCQQPLLTLLLPSASAPLLIPSAPSSPSHSLLPWLCFIFRLTFWSFRPASLPLCSHSLEKIFFIVIKWKRGLLERAQASMCSVWGRRGEGLVLICGM